MKSKKTLVSYLHLYLERNPLIFSRKFFEENVERDKKENEEELVCEGVPQVDDYEAPIPFP